MPRVYIPAVHMGQRKLVSLLVHAAVPDGIYEIREPVQFCLDRISDLELLLTAMVAALTIVGGLLAIL